MKYLTIAVVLGAAALLLPACGGPACETEADCTLWCDCDGDGQEDMPFVHNCSNGMCSSSFGSDESRGCEELCSDLLM